MNAAAACAYEFAQHTTHGDEVGHRDRDLVSGAANQRHEHALDAAILEYWPAVEEEHRALVAGEHFADWPAATVRHAVMFCVAPKLLHGLSELALAGADHSHVHIAPAAGRGQMAAHGVVHRFQIALIDDVHAAEVGYLVVNHEQLAVIALVEDAKQRKAPERLAERVELVDFDARLAQWSEKRGGGGQAADGVEHQTHIKTCTGAIDERIGDSLAGGVGCVDVRFEPNSFFRAADVGHHGLPHGGRFGEQPEFVSFDRDWPNLVVAIDRCSGCGGDRLSARLAARPTSESIESASLLAGDCERSTSCMGSF